MAGAFQGAGMKVLVKSDEQQGLKWSHSVDLLRCFWLLRNARASFPQNASLGEGKQKRSLQS